MLNYLHSTMYLLKPITPSIKLGKSSKFTFHYVSIKTLIILYNNIDLILNLHSTMYLLKL